MRKERRVRHADSPQMPTQIDVLRGVLLLAAQVDAWMTLGELARKTEFPEASISARGGRIGRRKFGGSAGRSCCGGNCFRPGNIFGRREKRERSAGD